MQDPYAQNQGFGYQQPPQQQGIQIQAEGMPQQGYPPMYPPQQQGYPIQQGYPPQYPQQGQPPFMGQQYQQQPIMTQPGGPAQFPQQYPAMGQPMIVQPVQVLPLARTANNCQFSTQIQCPSCSNIVRTQTHYKVGDHTILGAVLCCVCVFPLCFLYPLLNDDCKDVIHYCPKCASRVGVKEYRMC